MQQLPIVPYKPVDNGWVMRLWLESQELLGDSNVASRTLWRYEHRKAANEYLVVVPQTAFFHYRLRKDGVRVGYELAVSASARGQGYGQRLLAHAGWPMTLKTTAGAANNTFYAKLGFIVEGQSYSKNGDRLILHYARWK